MYATCNSLKMFVLSVGWRQHIFQKSNQGMRNHRYFSYSAQMQTASAYLDLKQFQNNFTIIHFGPIVFFFTIEVATNTHLNCVPSWQKKKKVLPIGPLAHSGRVYPPFFIVVIREDRAPLNNSWHFYFTIH